MTRAEIDTLLAKGMFPEPTDKKELIETHISWVILCDQFVYKIKKPIRYSFLDFSTLERRKHYCERELILNKRFARNIYLRVLPIYKIDNQYVIGEGNGNIIDYCLEMIKMDPKKRMDLLVLKNMVGPLDIENLAKQIAAFHKNTKTIYKKDVLDIKKEFNDLAVVQEYLARCLGKSYARRINNAIIHSDDFLLKNRSLLKKRLRSGFYRDCHGDLHTRNIFLLPRPQPFDCIEFNEEYRQIDVLNEASFLCMDLDAMGRKDLSDLFITTYNLLFKTMRTAAEHKLFVYYKSYRANVRAKVNSLRARSATNPEIKKKALQETRRYLDLMDTYLEILHVS